MTWILEFSDIWWKQVENQELTTDLALMTTALPHINAGNWTCLAEVMSVRHTCVISWLLTHLSHMKKLMSTCRRRMALLQALGFPTFCLFVSWWCILKKTFKHKWKYTGGYVPHINCMIDCPVFNDFNYEKLYRSVKVEYFVVMVLMFTVMWR